MRRKASAVEVLALALAMVFFALSSCINSSDEPTWQKIGRDVRITNDASYSGFPSLAWTGSKYGVSWEDERDGNDEIYFARIGLVP